jgi:hypothetical protein
MQARCKVPDASWKQWERRVAALFGGTRRGPDNRTAEAGKSDIIHPHWAVECKLLGRPSFAALLAAARQAESNAEPHHCPVAVVKRKLRGSPDTEALVVFRLETFLDWFV